MALPRTRNINVDIVLRRCTGILNPILPTASPHTHTRTPTHPHPPPTPSSCVWLAEQYLRSILKDADMCALKQVRLFCKMPEGCCEASVEVPWQQWKQQQRDAAQQG